MARADSRAFAEMVERFAQVVARAVSRTLYTQVRTRWYVSPTFDRRLDQDEVEELTHEVLMLLPAAIERFRGEASADTYVQAIARNHVLRVLKRRAREARRRLHMPAHLQEQETTEEAWLDQLSTAQGGEVPFDEALAQAEADRQAVASFEEMARQAGLTPEQAEVVRLRRLGWSDAEIARQLGCTSGTVRKRYFDAKAKLRRLYLGDPRWKE